MIFLSTLLIAMFATIGLIPIFKSAAIRLNAMDIPDERKIHSCPTPKCGGIAMAFGILIPVVLWLPGGAFARNLLIGGGILVLFGVIDDLRPLRFEAKFAGQFAAAAVVVVLGGIQIRNIGILLPSGSLLPEWCSIPLTLLVIVGVTNAINLSDGLDGLAGGIALLSFGCIGYLAYTSNQLHITLLSAAVVGAILGFLRYNTYPAILFMGDTGSQILGFLAAVFSIALTQENSIYSPFLPLIILAFPVLDTLAVMLERLYRGKMPFIADKNHFHHKLMELKFHHYEAVLLIYVLQAMLVTAAITFRFQSDFFLLTFYVSFSGLILVGFYITGKRRWTYRRFDFIEQVIKGRLRILKGNRIFIKVSFRLVEIGFLALLLFTALLPTYIPIYFTTLAMVLTALIVVTWLTKKKWVGGVLTLTVYLLVPSLIYLSELEATNWMSQTLTSPYAFSFGLLLLFVLFTLKFTRRKKGFKTTPMDFLILFIIFAVANLPDAQIPAQHIGIMAAKIIILFFSYEVLVGEWRGNMKKMGVATVVTLSLISARGLIGLLWG